jgi:ketopantoate hydroxymethyltransferase
MTIKAAKAIKGEIEKAGLDNLKILAEKGVSIVGTYLQGCAPKKQAELRRDFNGLLAMGITMEMVLDEVARQIPELAPIMTGREGYKKAELEKISEFLKGA